MKCVSVVDNCNSYGVSRGQEMAESNNMAEKVHYFWLVLKKYFIFAKDKLWYGTA